MENSFSKYRNGVESGSDGEFVDNSFVEDLTYSVKKKKNRTVFVPESEESTTDGNSQILICY